MVTRQIGAGMYQQQMVTECQKCPNVRLRTDREDLSVEIDAGQSAGDTVRLREEGEPFADGPNGDLIFQVVEAPHPRFRREGAALHVTVRLTLAEALVGFRKAIVHLDGHQVPIASDGGVTVPGAVRTVRGEGMPVPGGKARGDLHVHFDVTFPDKLTLAQRRAVQAIGMTFAK